MHQLRGRVVRRVIAALCLVGGPTLLSGCGQESGTNPEAAKSQKPPPEVMEQVTKFKSSPTRQP